MGLQCDKDGDSTIDRWNFVHYNSWNGNGVNVLLECITSDII